MPGNGKWWVLHVHELENGRLVIGDEMPSPDGWCVRLAAAVEREIAGEELGLPGLFSCGPRHRR
jgi:hypothetical protein